MITQKAEDLGRMIGQAEEYKALRRAQERLRESGELAEQLRRLEQLARGLESAAERGETAAEADVSAYDQLLSAIQSDPTYQSMVASQSNFDKLMMQVNEHILEGMKKGAASPIITLS